MECTKYYRPIDYLTTRQKGLSYIRLLHASPDIPEVDIYLDDIQVDTNLKYKNFTPYLGVHPGLYSISVFPTGQSTNPALKDSIEVVPDVIYTAAAVGKEPDIRLYVVPDPRVTPLMNRTRVRFVHLSPTTPPVDISLHEGTELFSEVGYMDITGYKTLTPGRYTLDIRSSGTDEVVLAVPNVTLRPGRNLSVYAVGMAGRGHPLQVLIPLDGSTYLPK